MAYTHAKSYPAEHLQDGEIWPNGTLKDTAPIEAHFSKALAQRLHHARAGRSLKEVAHIAGVSQDAISRLLRGKTWGTIPVIVRIEARTRHPTLGHQPHHNPKQPTTTPRQHERRPLIPQLPLPDQRWRTNGNHFHERQSAHRRLGRRDTDISRQDEREARDLLQRPTRDRPAYRQRPVDGRGPPKGRRPLPPEAVTPVRERLPTWPVGSKRTTRPRPTTTATSAAHHRPTQPTNPTTQHP